MSTVFQHKKINSVDSAIVTTPTGEISFSRFPEQRIPSVEVSLMVSPVNPSDTSLSQICCVQPVAVSVPTNGISDNTDTPYSSSPHSTDHDMNEQSGPAVVPTNASPGYYLDRKDASDTRQSYGVIFQDHNYGAPLPQTTSFPHPAPMESDDLPKLIVPISKKSNDTPKFPENDSMVDESVAQSLDSLKDNTERNGKVQLPQKLTKKQKEMISHASCNHFKENPDLKPKVGGTRCICGFSHDDGFMIQCECCTSWQHVVCFELSKESMKKKFFCDMCLPRIVNIQRAMSIQERKVKRGSVKGSQKKEPSDKNTNPHTTPKPKLSKVPHQSFDTPKLVETEPTLSAASANSDANISREERKLLAIMRQFEEMEKKSKEKVDQPHAEVVHKSPSSTTNVPPKIKMKSSPSAAEKSVPEFSSKRKVGKIGGLSKLSEKKGQKAVKDLKAKLNRRSNQVKREKQANARLLAKKSVEKSPASRPTSAKAKLSDTLPNKVEHGNSLIPDIVTPGTEKRQAVSHFEVPTPEQPFNRFIDSGGLKVPENTFGEAIFKGIKGLKFFPYSEVRASDIVNVASPPGSPEPVLAPLKKRYARADSSTVPMESSAPAIPQTPKEQPSATQDATKNCSLGDIFQQQDGSRFISTSEDVIISVMPTITAPEMETGVQPTVVKEPVEDESISQCPAVEAPAKKKVSLSEYKNRIRENPEAQVSLLKSKSDNSDSASQNNVEFPASTDKLLKAEEESAVKANESSDHFLANVDVDNDDILLVPLPSDDHLTGGLPRSAEVVYENAVLASTEQDHRKGAITNSHSKSRRRHHRALQVSSDLRVIIPTKAERVAKLNRVDRWLDDVVKEVNSDDLPGDSNAVLQQSTATADLSRSSTPGRLVNERNEDKCLASLEMNNEMGSQMAISSRSSSSVSQSSKKSGTTRSP